MQATYHRDLHHVLCAVSGERRHHEHDVHDYEAQAGDGREQHQWHMRTGIRE